MNQHTDKVLGGAWGSFIGDALAMPVHWYYDRRALFEDYGEVREYLAPSRPHRGSILWRSSYTPINAKGDILHDQARFWGQRDIHYHQQLRAGENTLNLQLAMLLLQSLDEHRGYDPDAYLQSYVEFMLTPGSHRDTYVEECHRKFFTNYARGRKPHRCGEDDIHIGGLAHVGVLCAWHAGDEARAREAVQTHVALTHRSQETLQAADVQARILCEVLRGGSLTEGISEFGGSWLGAATIRGLLNTPDSVVVGQRFSTACYIREAFPAVLYLAWKYADQFENGLIANTNLGGDNCHRGAVLGSLLGSATGWSSIPSRWIEGLQCGNELRKYFAHHVHQCPTTGHGSAMPCEVAPGSHPGQHVETHRLST